MHIAVLVVAGSILLFMTGFFVCALYASRKFIQERVEKKRALSPNASFMLIRALGRKLVDELKEGRYLFSIMLLMVRYLLSRWKHS
jgi:hypothetical protein